MCNITKTLTLFCNLLEGSIDATPGRHRVARRRRRHGYFALTVFSTMEVSEERIDPLSHYNISLSVYHHVLLELGHSLLCQTALWYPSLDKWRDRHLEIRSRSSWKCQQIMPPTFEIVGLSERKLDCSQIELVQDFWWLTAPLGMKADLLLWHSSSLVTWCLWHVITNIVRQRTPKRSHHILTSPLWQQDTPYRKTNWHSQLRI